VTTNHHPTETTMTNCPTTVESAVRRCLSRILYVPASTLAPTVHLVEYGMDSLDVAEFAFDVGKELGCHVDPASLHQCRTVGDVTRRVGEVSP
jgi:acyl carrier protein